MENIRDWLSRLLEMIPVKGTLDYRCLLGAPWRIDFAASELGEIPYHVILAGPPTRRTRQYDMIGRANAQAGHR
jgi:hypothetical protein